MADENAAEVEEEPEVFVGDFEADGGFFGEQGVEVAGFDAGVFGYVIDDGFVDGDVVVHEGDAFVGGAAAKGGDAAEALTDRTGGFPVAVGVDVEGFALEDDEFGVDSYVCAGLRDFDAGFQGEALEVGDVAGILAFNEVG